MSNAFDKETKYKLFRSIREIINPAISKKNVSDYKIIFDEECLPLRVFYPKKIIDISKIIIFIHGNDTVTECTSKYAEICKKLALKTNHSVFAIDYKDLKGNYKEMYQGIYDTIKYLYKELERNGIDINNITLAGDSTGCNIVTGINYLNKKEIPIKQEILFYPVLSLEYSTKSYESMNRNEDYNIGLVERLDKYYHTIVNDEDINDKLLRPLQVEDNNNPSTLILTGNVDSLKDEAREYYEKIGDKDNKYVELPFCSHGFLRRIDKDLEKDLFGVLNDFLK